MLPGILFSIACVLTRLDSLGVDGCAGTVSALLFALMMIRTVSR